MQQNSVPLRVYKTAKSLEVDSIKSKAATIECFHIEIFSWIFLTIPSLHNVTAVDDVPIPQLFGCSQAVLGKVLICTHHVFCLLTRALTVLLWRRVVLVQVWGTVESLIKFYFDWYQWRSVSIPNIYWFETITHSHLNIVLLWNKKAHLMIFKLLIWIMRRGRCFSRLDVLPPLSVFAFKSCRVCVFGFRWA